MMSFQLLINESIISVQNWNADSFTKLNTFTAKTAMFTLMILTINYL